MYIPFDLEIPLLAVTSKESSIQDRCSQNSATGLITKTLYFIMNDRNKPNVQ